MQIRSSMVVGLLLMAVPVKICAQVPFSAQYPFPAPTLQSPPHKGTRLPQLREVTPTTPPSQSIPIEPLGFSAPSPIYPNSIYPGPIYLGQRSSMVSLDFLDEDHLLFTFRVPGLLHRDPNFDNGKDSDERHVRAVVLRVPSGAVQAEALWTLHDRLRYVWPLRDGHFLLREGADVKQGDASLALQPLFHFPGPLYSLVLDPGEEFIATNSHEPAAISDRPQASPANTNGDASGSPSLLAPHAGPEVDPQTLSDRIPQLGWSSSSPSSPSKTVRETLPEVVVRILRRSSDPATGGQESGAPTPGGQVLWVSRVHSPVHLPVNSDGYLEALQGAANDWTVNHHTFAGTIATIAHVDSACPPYYEFISEQEVLILSCALNGGSQLMALSISGQKLWQKSLPMPPAWMLTQRAANGLRIGVETITTNAPVSPAAPLQLDDLNEQRLTVYDAATGNQILNTPASPILDAGGNVAFSPSGRRLAVLHSGNIDIWNLPGPPALASSPARP